jgi:hypothetical protein
MGKTVGQKSDATVPLTATNVPFRLFCPSCLVLADIFWSSCPLFPVLNMLAILTVHSSILSRLSCPSRHLPAVLPRLYCHGCHAMAVPYRLSCPICAVVVVMFWSSYSLFLLLYCTITTVLSRFPSRHSCPGFPIPVFLNQLPAPATLSRALRAPLCCLCCHVLAVLSSLSCPGSSVQAELSGRPVQTGLSRLSCPSGPISTVLPQVSHPGYPVLAVLAVMSWLSCTLFPALPVPS